jgi:hypothetical protein
MARCAAASRGRCRRRLPSRRRRPTPPADTATQPPRRSRERERARVHRHTVKRQIEASVTLPHIQKHGFTHPSNGHFLMLPPEYDVIQALEKKAVASVVLAVLRRTMGAPGDGPYGRKEWVQLSTHALADATLMAHGAARRGITEAVKKGYLLRRRAGGSYEYAIRWRGTN